MHTQIIDVNEGESYEEAEARAAAEDPHVAAERAFAQGHDTQGRDEAEAVEEPSEVQRLAAEPGAPEQPSAIATEYVDAEDESVREGWRATDLASVDWCLRRMAELEQEKAENEAIVEGRIAWERMRLEKLNASAERGIAFFRGRIAEYAHTHRAELLKGGKKKSRALPSGTVGWRKTGGGLAVTDGEALLAWARQQPPESEVLRIKEEPALKAIKAHFEATGELPDGMEQQPESEELQIKPVLPAKED